MSDTVVPKPLSGCKCRGGQGEGAVPLRGNGDEAATGAQAPGARAGLWLRAVAAGGLYAVALFLLVPALPAVGARTTATSDPDTAAGAFVCLVGSVVSLAATAAVARRWRSAWVLCLVHLGLIMVVWTQVPSPFVAPHVS